MDEGKVTKPSMANVPSTSQALNNEIGLVITASKLKGFERAELISKAITAIKRKLDAEYMKSIMPMQGSKLGFKTDKDPSGYTEDIVKTCLIEAVLTGVQPYGNQFNIIAGNCYITKEGFGYLLQNFEGLKYEIIPGLPRINSEKTSAAISMKISWTIGSGTKNEREIEFPIKSNQYMGTDGIIGKATRKARAWLFNTISGSEISDGDVQDIDYKIERPGQVDQEVKAEQVKEGVTNLFNANR